MTLDELRAAVRGQLDLDETELTNERVDFFLRAGFDHTVQQERDWPTYETQWTIAMTEGARSATLPADFAIHETVIHPTHGKIEQLQHDFALTQFHDPDDNTGLSVYFSIRGGAIWMWPYIPAEDFDLTVTGYRLPRSFPTAGGDEPDADERLHASIVWYACALAKAQEEDEVLGAYYMQQWREATAVAKANIMAGDPDQVIPRRLNAGTTKLTRLI